MPEAAPEGFSERLAFALKTANMSPAGLGAAVGVDKSVVSRWLSGRTSPSSHNLSRISAEIARVRPGFTSLAFEAPGPEFLAALGVAGPAALAPPGGLTIPFNLVEESRREVARRGMEYFGHYHMYYWSFTRPGRIVRMAFLLRPKDGLIEAHYGGRGFSFRGWALLLLNRLYVIFAEERYEAMAFLVTNAGQQPETTSITALLVGPSDIQMVPTAAPVLLLRKSGLSDDPEADAATFEAEREATDPFAAGDAAPPAVRDALEALARLTTTPAGGTALLQVPYIAV